jgi:hypothetical protein
MFLKVLPATCLFLKVKLPGKALTRQKKSLGRKVSQILFIGPFKD